MADLVITYSFVDGTDALATEVNQNFTDIETYVNAMPAATATYSNKTINLSNNTVTGTIDQFNTACSDANFATIAGSETLSNKTFDAPALGTPVSGVLTNCTGTAANLTAGIANGLKSATTTVAVNSATAPSSGQRLTATSSTSALWQTPPAASETLAGEVELATAAETATGTDNTRAVHPAGMKSVTDNLATKANPTFTGVAKFPDGSASAPSVTNTDDDNTGILFPAADTIGFTCGGTQQASVTTDGLWSVRSGVLFPASQVTSTDPNALDDYEEGTWTPAIAFSVSLNSVGVTYNQRSGKYKKIGSLVYLIGDIQLSSKGSSTGYVSITGLPFSLASGNPPVGSFFPWTAVTSPTNTVDLAVQNAASTTLQVVASISGGATFVRLEDTNMADTSWFFFTIVYPV